MHQTMDGRFPSWNLGDNKNIVKGESPRNENYLDYHDDFLLGALDYRLLASPSFGDLQNIIGGVPAPLQSNTDNTASKLESCEGDVHHVQLSGAVRKHEEMDKKTSSDAQKRNQNERKKRVAEVHNMSERRRRDRIKEKMKTLQELIPNCNMSDRASVLDDAIKYVQALKLQVELFQNVSAAAAGGGGMVFQAPYMLPNCGIQTGQQISQFSSYLGTLSGASPMRPVHLNGPNPSLPGALGLPQMSVHPGNHAVPLLQLPYVPPQQLPTSVSATTAAALPPNVTESNEHCASKFKPNQRFCE